MSVRGQNAVIVTTLEGRHRLSYTRPAAGCGIPPRGVCTDALSHILVVNYKTNTVQMLNESGKLLSYVLTEPQTEHIKN